MARIAITAIIIFIASASVSDMIAIGSVCTKLSNRLRSGHISTVITVPISASLTRPLTKLAIACLENSRLRPASGEILENFGVSDS